jgi:hypothetical protein
MQPGSIQEAPRPRSHSAGVTKHNLITNIFVPQQKRRGGKHVCVDANFRVYISDLRLVKATILSEQKDMLFYLALFCITAYFYWHFVYKRKGLPPGKCLSFGGFFGIVLFVVKIRE